MGIIFDYPEDGDGVPGKGSFFAWGTFDGLVLSVVRGEVDWTEGGAAKNQSKLQGVTPVPADAKWAFSFSGIHPDDDGTGHHPATFRVVFMRKTSETNPIPVQDSTSIDITINDHGVETFRRRKKDEEGKKS
jgi:hypothetical protein